MRRVQTQVGAQVMEWYDSAADQNTMVALAKLSAAVFGTAGVASGLACTQQATPNMTVQIGAGELYQLAPIEATTCGTLPANTAYNILKQGIQLGTYNTAAFTAPGTAGQSINYLIQAQYQDQDLSLDPTTGATTVVLPFYNAQNPAVPWTGPNNSGVSSYTFRDGVIAYQIVAGTAATTGTQTTPTPTAGWLGLWVVTVANGQATITNANITRYAASTPYGGILGGAFSFSSLTVDGAAHTDSGVPFSAVNINSLHQGTVTGAVPQYNYVTINSDTSDASATSNNAVAFGVNFNFGGTDPSRANASAAGGRTGFRVHLSQTGPILGAAKNYVGAELWSSAQYNMGGSDFAANTGGEVFGMNPMGYAAGTATFLYGVSGGEVNVGIWGGASARNKVGWKIIQLSNDTTAGAGGADALLYLGSQRPTGATQTMPVMIYGIRIGDRDSQWMFDNTSTIFGIKAQSDANLGGAPIRPINANYGIDFSLATFATGAFKSTGFLVDGAGFITTNGIHTTTNGLACSATDNSSSAIVANPGGAFATTYTQSGTAGSIDLLINRIETSLGTGSHKFLDFQISGASKASIDNKGGASFLYAKTTGNVAASNGSTTSYTVPDDTAYVYITTTAASMAMTLPAAAPELDGHTITICTSAAVGTATWSSTGATFVGAPSSFSANTPVKLKYVHAQLKWYIA